ncbi:MAG: hypothetical protein ACON44_06250 [Candidatus Puniceispirillaceae bacterium]
MRVNHYSFVVSIFLILISYGLFACSYASHSYRAPHSNSVAGQLEHDQNFCYNVAIYVQSQYDNDMPTHIKAYVQLKDDKDAIPAFVNFQVHSLYDVVYQHKGFDAVIESCLERRGHKLAETELNKSEPSYGEARYLRLSREG